MNAPACSGAGYATGGEHSGAARREASWEGIIERVHARPILL